MNCADFENALTRVLGDDIAAEEREARVAELRAHAEACPDCAGAMDLLELLALPPAERDVVPAPLDSYWERFEAGLRDRLAGEPPARRGWTAWGGAAAALLLAAAALWLVFPFGDPAIPGTGVAGLGPGTDEIPEPLGMLLRAAEQDEALAGLDFLGGLGGVPEAVLDTAESGGGGGGAAGLDGRLYPDPAAMDAEDRRALLDWLRAAEQRGRGAES